MYGLLFLLNEFRRRMCMLGRLSFVLAMMFLAALPAFACPAYYSGDQCQQGGGGDDQNDGSTGDGSGGGGACPYYMCGNATGAIQVMTVWCEATGSYEECPIYYCVAQACIGRNCSPSTGVCKDCSSNTGNNVHTSTCPR
jgi:hypothetical protein